MRRTSVLLGALLLTFTANADFVCRSDVTYKWIKKVAGATAESKEGANSETTVRFASVERSAQSEATAKAALQAELTRLKSKASDACKRDHENLSGCVSTKFSMQASTLFNMSFSARRELEKAVTADCQLQLGTCVTAASTEPVCEERKPPETPTPAAGGKEEKKKK